MSKKVSETVSNRFLDKVEEKYIGRNPILRLISRIKFNKFCRDIMKSSPSLGVLWYFADFIKLAERVYFFNNVKDGKLFSSRSYVAGENGFIVNAIEEGVRILVKLDSDTQSVLLEIKRPNNLTTEHRFINNQWGDDRQDYDEVLIDNIIAIMNSYMVGLLKWCWDRKGNFDSYERKVVKE